LKFDKIDTLQNIIETFVDDHFTNLTPLGRIISNKEINYNSESSKKLPEFKTLIDEDKSAFEVSLLYILYYFNMITCILIIDT